MFTIYLFTTLFFSGAAIHKMSFNQFNWILSAEEFARMNLLRFANISYDIAAITENTFGQQTHLQRNIKIIQWPPSSSHN